MTNQENLNQSTERAIYIKDLHQWVHVSNTDYDNYYRDINAYRRRQQEHGRCVYPSSKRYLCDMDCFTRRFRKGGDELSLDYTFTDEENQKYFIPMEVTKETIKDFNLDSSQVVPAKIGNKIVSAIMIPATQEQYEAYMRPIWAEMKREERSRRCMVSNGKGKLKRCDGDCKKCEKMKDGAALSLESFFEENGLEFEDTSSTQCETILTAMLFEDLLENLRRLAPELTPIFEMLYDGMSQRTIANLINKPQSSVNDMIKRMRKILQQHISRNDLAR